MEFTNLVAVCAVGAAVPALLGLVPRVLVPAAVVEIIAGILLGPSGLDWIQVDTAVSVVALIGLSFLLFLAGLEIDPMRLRGRSARQAGAGLLLSLALALLVGLLLQAVGVVGSGLFLAVVLSATSLGLVVPILKDAGATDGPIGQLTIAGSSLADITAVLLLSLLFAKDASGPGARLLLLGLFGGLIVVVAVAVTRVEHVMRISDLVNRLDETTAQLRVRLSVLLLVGLAAVAQQLGLEAILGAFLAGAILRVVDADPMRRHPTFRLRLEGIGFGFVIPVFFVTSGLRFDLGVLFSSASVLVRVPLFLAALLVVRGLAAITYRHSLTRRETVAAALLQSTTLPFVVAATAIGVDIGTLSPANASALVAASLLSVLIFPAVALRLLRGSPAATDPAPARDGALPSPAPPGDNAGAAGDQVGALRADETA